jgi:hypothetical protein
MLRSEPLDQLVAVRLLDFFGAETPWQRRLWDVGTCVSLREIVEAANAVVAGALSSEALNWLKGSVLELSGRDVGIGTPAERSTLTAALKGNVAQGSFDARVIDQIAESAEDLYLRNWSVALAAGGDWRGERIARSVASHMLGLGFSGEYLHRWWSYRIRHEAGERSLAELVEDAHSRSLEALTKHEVIVPLQRATSRAHEIPGWISPEDASALLTPLNKKPIAGLAGALRIMVTARDPLAAVESSADVIDRYVARITLGGGGEGLAPLPYVWVNTYTGFQRLRLRRSRGLELPVLLRRDEPITDSVAPRIDSSLELLGPVDRGPVSSAVAGGWAAVETLLTAPGDRGKVQAADRLAALIACSFPRAELTRLAHHIVEHDKDANPELADALESATTNTTAAGRLAKHLETSDVVFGDVSDQAASRRLQALVRRPNEGLRDIEEHLQRSLRRLYRVRNLVLHNAATDSLTLSAALLTAAPLLGAGIDRVVRGALLQDIEPLDLAARARIVIDNADHSSAGDLADLLQLAET